MSVTVSYRWRKSEVDEWSDDSITFDHLHDPRPDYLRGTSGPKMSAARKAWEDEDERYRVWEILRDSALTNLRDYFRDGGDGSAIPDLFKVTVDAYSKDLNNYSTRFWLDNENQVKR